MSEKYFRTPHLPNSPGGTSDDRRITDVSPFIGRRVIITRKMDGSNTSMTRECCYARSHSGQPRHPSFDTFKRGWSRLSVDIPENWSVFGEWVYAVHSIAYREFRQALLSFPFMVFGVRDDITGEWFAWDDVVSIANLLDLHVVSVLFDGVILFEKDLDILIRSCHNEPDSQYVGENEGVVIRIAEQFTDASTSIAKYVRADHVQTDDHWTAKKIVRNGL